MTGLTHAQNRESLPLTRTKLISKIDILIARHRSFVSINEVICQFFFSKIAGINCGLVRSVLNMQLEVFRTSFFDHSGREREEGGLEDLRFT